MAWAQARTMWRWVEQTSATHSLIATALTGTPPTPLTFLQRGFTCRRFPGTILVRALSLPALKDTSPHMAQAAFATAHSDNKTFRLPWRAVADQAAARPVRRPSTAW